MQKPYRSVMKRVVLWPLVIMLILSFAVFMTAMLNYSQTKENELDNHLAVMRSGYLQLQNVMKQCEFTFSRFFSTETSSGLLKNVKEGDQPSKYFEAIVDSVRFLEPVKDANELVDGIFLYFPNIPTMQFRGITQMDLHETISERLAEKDIPYNHWFLLSTDQNQYIVYVMNSQNACCGCWMRTEYVKKRLGLQDSGDWSGQVYFTDLSGENTLKDETLHLAAASEKAGSGTIRTEKGKYDNYVIRESTHGICFGLLIPEDGLFRQMPLIHRIVFLLAFSGLAATIAVVFWMNSRISRPVLLLKDAMEQFGNGNVEYRLEERDKKTIDEFDLLGRSLNEMMDKVNELEYHLYETKLREQEIQLKYISQQIRPHFILNALNVIYTYREDEFPLVKKMVIYLVNYFRYIVNLRVDFVELSQEFRHVENYLKIQKERTQNRIDFFVEWEQAVSDVYIPPLILQTFVENSIKYAVNENKLYVIVRAQEEKGRLKIRVSDTGQGYSEETLRCIRRFLETREDDGSLGVGIVNAVERMDILYHGDISLTVGNAPTGGAFTEIYLPLLREPDIIGAAKQEG